MERESQRISSLVTQLGLDITPFEKLIDHMVVSGSKDTIAVIVKILLFLLRSYALYYCLKACKKFFKAGRLI